MNILALILALVCMGVHNFYVNNLSRQGIVFTVFWRELFSSITLFFVWIVAVKFFSVEILPFNLKGNLIAFFGGFFAYLMLYLYYKAMSLEKIGPVSTIVYGYVGFVAILSLALSWMGFSDYGNLSFGGYVGIFIFVGGLIVLSFKSKGTAGVKMAIVAMVSYALLYIFWKQVPSLIGILFAAFVARFSVFIVAGIPFLIKRDFGWFKFKQEKFRFPTRKEFGWLVSLALLVAIAMVGISYSIHTLEVEYVALGIGMCPIITMLFTRIVGKEKLTVREVFGILVIFAGIALILFWKPEINLKEISREAFFAILSATIVFISYLPYAIRVWRRDITPKLASWIIFVLISFALILSYDDSGAKENLFVTYGPFIGCSAILIILLLRCRKKGIGKSGVFCLILGAIALVLWYFTEQEYAKYALYLAILADLAGMYPSIKGAIQEPWKDRPAMWFFFGVGYSIIFFAITDHTFSNWVLPVFMTVIPATVWGPLVRYRIKNKIPIKEWI